MFPKGTTSKQVEEENTAEMVDSQQEAIAVALRATGAKVPEVISIAQVAGRLTRQGRAAGRRRGRRASTASRRDSTEAVRAAVQKHKPGGDGRADGAPGRGHHGGSRRAPPTRTGTTVLGVLLRTRFAFPVKVSINAGDVGGPSAGMMFSLAIYDKLTPGALTGGAEDRRHRHHRQRRRGRPDRRDPAEAVRRAQRRRPLVPRAGRQLQRGRRPRPGRAAGRQGRRRSTRRAPPSRPSPPGKGDALPTCTAVAAAG